MPLDCLNSDVLLQIVDSLEVDDAWTLRNVCRTLYSIIQNETVWRIKLEAFIHRQIPLTNSFSRRSPASITSLSLAQRQQVALKTAALDRNWTSPAPISTSYDYLPSSLLQKRAHKKPILRFVEDKYLLISVGPKLEICDLSTMTSTLTYESSSEIISIQVVDSNPTTLSIMVLLDSFTGREPSEGCGHFQLLCRVGDGEVLRCQWQHTVAMAEYWMVGRPSISGEILVYTAMQRPSASRFGKSSPTHHINLVHWQTNTTRTIVIESAEVICTSYNGWMAVASRKTMASNSVVFSLYNISDLSYLTVDVPAATYEFTISEEIDESFQLELSDLTIPENNHTILFSALFIPVLPVRSIVRVLLRADVRHSDQAASYDLKSINTARIDIKPNNSRWETDNRYLTNGTGTRGCLLQCGRNGPGAQTSGSFSACTFRSDGSVIFNKLAVGDDEERMKNISTHAFLENFGLLAWANYRESAVHLCRY